MDKSFKRFFIMMLLVGCIYSGFVWGRSLGVGMHPHRPTAVLRDISRMLSANANGGALGDPGTLQDPDNGMPPAELFETVLEHINRDYIDANESNLKLSNGALARMFASLNDNKTLFLEPNLCAAREAALKGSYHGIGAVVTTTVTKKADVEYRHLTIVGVMPGSPAEKAGLQSGDYITDIDGRWIIAYPPRVDADILIKRKLDDATLNAEFKKLQTKFLKGYSLTKALPVLLTGEGKTLKLSIERNGQATPLKVELTTGLTKVEPVEYKTVGNNVGYLRVRQFNAEATDEFQKVLGDLGSGLKGLIVDLRSNPGGVRADAKSGVDGYQSALQLIAHLTRGGKVATIERKPKQKEALNVTPAQPAVKLPLVVLVDHGTANLSELVTSALRDSVKAKVIGSRTFGDPILQLFVTFKNGSGAELSNARLFTVAGADFATGILPDVLVSAQESQSDDAVLKRALATLGA